LRLLAEGISENFAITVSVPRTALSAVLA